MTSDTIKPGGQLAEAVAKVALEFAVAELGVRKTVTWMTPPEGAATMPSLAVESTQDHISNLVLVDASQNPGGPGMRYWATVGEILDVRSRLYACPPVLYLLYGSEAEAEVVEPAGVLSDAVHLVDQDENHGPEITHWLNEHQAIAPSGKAENEGFVRAAAQAGSDLYHEGFANALAGLGHSLAAKLDLSRKELKPLGQMLADDLVVNRQKRLRTAKNTFLRRGLSQWLVFDEGVRYNILRNHLSGKPTPLEEVPDYAITLNMLEKGVSGAKIPSREPAELSAEQATVTGGGSDLSFAAECYMLAARGDVEAATTAMRRSLEQAPPEMAILARSVREMPHRHAFEWRDYAAHCQDFEPLAELVQAACGNKVTRCSVPTIMSDLTGPAVNGSGWGLISVFAFERGYICWKSVTDTDRANSLKELSGQARALRLERTTEGFRKRPEARRLYLVIDGSFTDRDLRMLTDAGWDQFFYPQEMDLLVTRLS